MKKLTGYFFLLSVFLLITPIALSEYVRVGYGTSATRYVDYPITQESYGSVKANRIYNDIFYDGNGNSRPTTITTNNNKNSYGVKGVFKDDYNRQAYGSTRVYSNNDYERDSYGSVRAYNTYTYNRDGYGTANSKVTYVITDNGYGTTYKNQAGIKGAIYVTDGYGTTYKNQAGIKGATYVTDGYGSGTSRSGLVGNTWVKCVRCYNQPSSYTELHYTPVGIENSGQSNYYYLVKGRKRIVYSYN